MAHAQTHTHTRTHTHTHSLTHIAETKNGKAEVRKLKVVSDSFDAFTQCAKTQMMRTTHISALTQITTLP